MYSLDWHYQFFYDSAVCRRLVAIGETGVNLPNTMLRPHDRFTQAKRRTTPLDILIIVFSNKSSSKGRFTVTFVKVYKCVKTRIT